MLRHCKRQDSYKIIKKNPNHYHNELMIFFIAECKVDYIFLLFDNFGEINRAIILTIVILEETKIF